MKLLLGAKKYLEQSGFKKKKEMDPDRADIEDHEELAVPDAKTLPMKLLVSVALHPFDYAKNLITMGYEPLPAYQAPWFGRTYYMYPNVFKYVGHIYSVDGLLGCFRGIISKSTSLVVQSSLISYCDKKYPPPPMKAPLLDKLKRNIAVRCACTIVAHPLQLMTVRCMAQFVGRESLFSEWNFLSNIFTVLKLEGLAGLFKGFWARLAGEICMVASSVIIVHSIYSWHMSRDTDEDEPSRERSMVIYSTVVNFACVSFFYPYNVVSTTMMVNKAGLKIGESPMSPTFHSSHHCYSYLGYMNQLKRGSSLFYRWVPSVSRADERLTIKST